MMGSGPPAGNDLAGAFGLLEVLSNPDRTRNLLKTITDKTEAMHQIAGDASAKTKEAEAKASQADELLCKAQEKHSSLDANEKDLYSKESVLHRLSSELMAKEKDLEVQKFRHAKEVERHAEDHKQRTLSLEERERKLHEHISRVTEQAVKDANAAKLEAEQHLAYAKKQRVEAQTAMNVAYELKSKFEKKLASLSALAKD